MENKERPWWKTISEEFLRTRNGVISESQRSKSEENKNPNSCRKTKSLGEVSGKLKAQSYLEQKQEGPC